MPRTEPPTPAPEPCCGSSRREIVAAWAVTLGVLLAATWPLWTPLRDTPLLPPLGLLAGLPPTFDYVFLAGVIFGVFNTLRGRRGVGMATAALLALMALDQLRWQPWAYHALLVGCVLTAAREQVAFKWLRRLTIAVYAFSAIAKLDATFAQTLGQQMLGVIALGTGIELDKLSEPTRLGIALTLPAMELAIAGLLAASCRWKRLATPACVAAVVMHAATVALLGPWGLGHSAGVLLWNVGFAWQTVVLFRPRGESASQPATTGSEKLAAALCVFAIAAPLLTPFGLGDQWLGWALYAPGGERATLYVHNAAVDRLPASLARFADLPADGSPWRRLRLDDWQLAETSAPIYPQNRIHAALAVALAERFPLTGRLRLVVESAAGRVDISRTSRELVDLDDFRQESQLFNLRPGAVWTR